MALIQIESKPARNHGLALLRLGFRPFFLLSGTGAVLFILYWLYILNGDARAPSYGTTNWHAHEMLFGFAVAVIAGFLLTAEKNWTNVQTLHGPLLGAFSLLWLAGRIVPWLPLPAWLIAIVDLSFLMLLAIILLVPLIKTSQFQHLIFVIIVLTLFAANLLFHLGQLQSGWNTTATGIRLAWLTIILLITIMGGRVIPFFIERGTGNQVKVKQSRAVEIVATITLLAWMLGMLLDRTRILVAYLALFACILQIMRWWGWHLTALWRFPMLWILYLGYIWIPLGLCLYAYSAFNQTSPSIALHAFTAGAIGMLTIGMMARVSLGHTGRMIATNPLLTSGFVLVSLGTLIRVVGPLLVKPLALDYLLVINVSGLVWALGFLIFVILYVPILTRPRTDGQPG